MGSQKMGSSLDMPVFGLKRMLNSLDWCGASCYAHYEALQSRLFFDPKLFWSAFIFYHARVQGNSRI